MGLPFQGSLCPHWRGLRVPHAEPVNRNRNKAYPRELPFLTGPSDHVACGAKSGGTLHASVQVKPGTLLDDGVGCDPGRTACVLSPSRKVCVG